jgi:hypothetical protein
VSFNTKKYWKQFFEDELGPLPELLYTQVSRVTFSLDRDHMLSLPQHALSASLQTLTQDPMLACSAARSLSCTETVCWLIQS